MTDGILVVDKPNGPTSHDIVLFVRRKFGIKKVGHAGTLDPMATGVLVLLIGKATKLSGRLVLDEKEYEGTLRLGVRTDTGDAEGRVVSEKKITSSGTGLFFYEESSMQMRPVPVSAIEDIFGSFRGAIEQTPPMVSAVKYNGTKLYELARRGIEVERRPRRVMIYGICVKKIDLPDISFSVRCSKGTYIRSLASDIADKIGCGGHLVSLRRIKSGRFGIKDSITFEELKRLDNNTLWKYIIH